MLEIKNISAGYRLHKVLDGISASFKTGEVTALIGANGCGKSTLLKSMAGILPVLGGNISVDGEDISRLGRTETARRIAYLAQGKNTPDMTVMQMVLHGRFPYLGYPRRYSSRDREIALYAIERVGLKGIEQSPMAALSGGMRQNAYIAMALAQDTEYILLDEPTTYLDISHQIELMRLLRSLAEKGKGIVTVMHDLPMAFGLSDRICVLCDSGTLACGTPSQICTSGIVEESFGVSLALSESGHYVYVYENTEGRLQ